MLFRSMMLGGVATPTTWDPADKGSGVTLSSDKRTATGPATPSDSTTRATKGRSSGMFSYRIINTGAGQVSIASAANKLDTNEKYPGQTSNGISLSNTPGASAYVLVGGNIIAVPVQSKGPIDVLLHLNARKAYFINNGVPVFNGGDPADGSGGYVCPSGLIFPAIDAQDSTMSFFLDVLTSRYPGYPAWG